MTIREVAYYEAWCDDSEPHQIILGDYVAYSDIVAVESELADTGGIIVRKSGHVFCEEHTPPDVCPDSDDEDQGHEWRDGMCVFCGRGQAVAQEATS